MAITTTLGTGYTIEVLTGSPGTWMFRVKNQEGAVITEAWGLPTHQFADATARAVAMERWQMRRDQ